MKILIFIGVLLGANGCVRKKTVPASAKSWERVPIPAPVDSGKSLPEVLQTEAGEQACDQYFREIANDPDWGVNPAKLVDEGKISRNEVLMCGKHIFFYGRKGGFAAPEFYIKAVKTAWPKLIGEDWSGLGLIANPDDPGFPVGMPGVPSNVVALAELGQKNRMISCAMCHFTKLDDDRYVVGATNEKIRFGRLAIAMSYMSWAFDGQRYDKNRWHPELIEKFQSLENDAKAHKVSTLVVPDFSRIPFGGSISHLIMNASGTPILSRQETEHYLHDEAGVGPNFFVALGSEQRIFINPPTIYGISARATDATTEVLGSFITQTNLEDHIREINIIATGSDEMTSAEWIYPVAEYVRTLRAPAYLGPLDSQKVQAGKDLFSRKCAGCHSNSQGGGSTHYPAKQMHIHDSYEAPIGPTLVPANAVSKKTVQLLKEAFPGKFQVTKKEGIRVKRLKGAWARQRLMFNGAVKGLNHAFCLDDLSRQGQAFDKDPLSDRVHEDLCTRYDTVQRQSLVEFLKSWH